MAEYRTAADVNGLIDELLDTANATTGQSDTNLKSAINHLKEGYGQGGTADPLEGYFDGSLTKITLPTITKIKDRAFFWGNTITDVTMPNVTEIGAYSFANCYNLNLSKLPNRLEKIGEYAFAETGITSLVFPSTLKEIGANAFDMCMSLTSVTFEGTPTSLSLSAFSGCLNDNLFITVPWAKGEVDEGNDQWGASNATIVYKNGEPLPPAEGDSRTWVLKGDTVTSLGAAQIPFTSNGRDYKSMVTWQNPESGEYLLKYSTLPLSDWWGDDYVLEDGTWASNTLSDIVVNYSGLTNEAFKTVTFADDTYKDNATYYTWLQANYTQQGSSGDDSGDSKETITFIVANYQPSTPIIETCTADKGMKWEEWIASDYNSFDWTVGYGYIWDGGGSVLKDPTNGYAQVAASAEIVADREYIWGAE